MVRLRRALLLRLHHRINRRLTLFSGWVWIGAMSLVGFEMFDILFGTFLLAPELLPVALLVLALAWHFRATLRRTRRRCCLWLLRRRRSRGQIAIRTSRRPFRRIPTPIRGAAAKIREEFQHRGEE